MNMGPYLCVRTSSLWIWVRMCVFVHIYKRDGAQKMHISFWIWYEIYIFFHAYIYLYLYLSIYLSIYIYIYICIYMHIQIYIYIYIYIYIIYIHIYIYIYTHIYIYIIIHIHYLREFALHTTVILAQPREIQAPSGCNLRGSPEPTGADRSPPEHPRKSIPQNIPEFFRDPQKIVQICHSYTPKYADKVPIHPVYKWEIWPLRLRSDLFLVYMIIVFNKNTMQSGVLMSYGFVVQICHLYTR